MKVQSVQSTNLSPNTNFKATFLNDVNGNFRNAWEKTLISDSFISKSKIFSQISEKSILEITELNVQKFGTYYKIFNHYNGKFAQYFDYMDNYSRNKNLLEFILDSIFKDKNLLSSETPKDSVFRLLTGNK